MDKIIIYIIISGVVSVAGWIIWVVFIMKMAKSAAKQAEQDLNHMLSQIEGLMNYMPQNNNQNLTPQQQAQITNMFIQAQMQMNQMDNLSKMRYETRIESIHGMAASAGLDLRSGSY